MLLITLIWGHEKIGLKQIHDDESFVHLNKSSNMNDPALDDDRFTWVVNNLW